MTLVTVTGSLWDTTGVQITEGMLTFTPTKPIPNGSDLVAGPSSVSISGPVTFSISPSFGVPYTVELDPDPDDTGTPTPLKDGYFKKSILVPNTGSIDLSTLLT